MRDEEPLSLDDDEPVPKPPPRPTRKPKPKRAKPAEGPQSLDEDEPQSWSAGYWSRISPTVKWSIVGVGGFVLLLLFVVGVEQLGSSNKTNHGAGSQKIYLREEFRAMLLGKTQDEVLEIVGKPESTSDSGDLSSWHYKRITKDPVTDKIDSIVFVHFDRGRVSSVDY
jgi:hypothetical protein